MNVGQRKPGEPLGGTVKLDDGEFGQGHALLIFSKPDYIDAPHGLEGFGIRPGARIDVLSIVNFPEECPVCRKAGRQNKDWALIHEPSGTRLRVIEAVCCNQFLWCAP